MKRVILVLTLVAIAVATASNAAAADKPTPQEWGVSNYGAAFTSDNGQIAMQIPPGTFSGAARYTPMTMADFPTTPPNSIWAADPFRLQFLIDREEGNNGSPSTLVVKYEPAGLGGRSEATLQIVKQTSDPSAYMVLPAP